MAVSQEIIENVKQVRNAAYGKDVREAIAKGLELCYGYTSGETAIEAAERANAAAEAAEGVTAESRETLADLERAVANVDDIVKISENQPTEAENKIWVRPQTDTEYKVATFAAYEALWGRMNDIQNAYQQGHGGIVSIVQDPEYEDPEDDLKKRYVITYSDTTTSEFFVNDGPAGPIGPLDQIKGTAIYYHKGVIRNNGTVDPRPPRDGWSSEIPQQMGAGDYLWTQTVITYESTAEAYIYGLTRWGINGSNGKDGKDGVDGTGAVHSFKIGENGERMVGDIVVQVDSAPTANSANILLSGAIYTALQSYAPIQSPSFTGSPSATTAPTGDSSLRIATTEFVKNSIDSLGGTRKIEITMSSASYSYLDSSITENTYCLFPNLGFESGLGKLVWETSNGMLTLTSTRAPAQAITFDVLLIDSSTDDDY
jgi:hypothetical protein